MKIMELFETVKEINTHIPDSAKKRLKAGSSMTNRTLMKELTAKIVVWGRAHYLAQRRFYQYVLAVVWAAALYFLMLGIFAYIEPVRSSWGGSLVGMTAFSVNVVFLHYVLWYYRPLMFQDILFEESVAVRKRIHRGLGIIEKIICEFQLILSTLCLINFIGGNPHIATLTLLLNQLLGGFLALGFFYYAAQYLINAKRGLHLRINDTPNGKIQIHGISGVHEVNLISQFVVELASGDLHIGRYTPGHNPDYDRTPEAYQIPAKSILYVQFGEKQIKYDWNKKKWIKFEINTVPAQ